MVQYIIQIIAFQVFFLLVYDVFLKRETFFNWNRFYLIGTSVLSLILPFVKVTAFKELVPKDYIVTLPEVFIGNKTVSNAEIVLPEVEITKQAFSWNLETLFYLGVVIASLLFVFKIVHILLLIYKNPKRWKGNVLLVELINSTSAFSFFHYVFLGANLKEEEQKVIIKHELVHVTQKHTLDLLFFEIQRIVFWFNPLVYMYQTRIRSLHEFIADQEALKTQNKSDYYQNLLSQVFDTQNVSFVNAFFKKSLIKKRIIMLSKSKSKQIVKFKYALLIPVVFGILVYTSSNAQENINKTETQELTFEQLVEKYYQEFLDMKAEGIANYHEAKRERKDKYVLSRDEHAKSNAYIKYSYKSIMLNPNPNKEKINKEFVLYREKVIKNLKNYKEYLAWKKTDEAKEIWENNIENGVLRLVVDDLDNLTSEEKNKYNKKKELLSKDVFFTQLMMTDVNGRRIFAYFNPNEFSSANKTDDTKAALINNPSVNVGFDVVEQPPMFEGCETLSREEQRKCTSEAITKHILKNFSTDLAGDLGLTGRQKIATVFKIDKEGNIIDVKVRAPHPRLEEEAKRVIKSLPKMIPGKQKGETVVVPYSLPIIFQVADSTDKKLAQQESIMIDEVEVPFYVIEQPPMSKDCETLASIEEQRKCTSDAITKHILENFSADLAGDLGLTGRQTIRVMFKINKEGDIEGVVARAPHPRLEEEAKRVIKSLPKMIPGKQKGKTVVVPYSLPIIFEVADKTDDKPSNNKIKHEEVPNKNQDIEVPYSHIEQPPMSKECKMLNSAEEQRKCTSQAVQKHVAKNFNTNLAGDLGLLGRQTIITMFKIDEKGRIVNIKARAPHPKLEEEAIRVIKSLPKMIPGKQKGKRVVVPFSLPIVFEVKESPNAIISYLTTENSNSKKDVEKQDSKEVPLVALDESPIYPGCNVTSSSDKLKECFKNSLANFISKEFGKNLPKNIDSELEPRQKILAMFKIDKTGYIESIRVRAKHPELEKEAIRVLKALPKMTPGKHKGVTVIVPYSVPIMYELGEKKN
ncbi:energy transducer TonB [Pontimicrobium sp. SW4]|uniref:Energy transducer TonB n=1 Tax=Pontimicrobium sp. SW4 TaxID=3153519 RepID=A0AAU7BTJ1_9FLAO